MKIRIAVLIILLFQVLFLVARANSQDLNSVPDIYLNRRFWDAETGQCFYPQETTNSCVSASIQIVLSYLDFLPLPNQTQLAAEMQTDINHPTQWRYVYIPFENRGFLEYFNQSLSDDFNVALSHLKSNVSENFPVIINSWYDQHAKLDGQITHARVVTGYNLTGVFLHDPLAGPNQFMDNVRFSSLWKTELGYWAFIIKKEPTFDLSVEVNDWFGNPIPGVRFVLIGETNYTRITDLNGIATFSNLPMANYVLSYDWQSEIRGRDVTLTKSERVRFSWPLSSYTIFEVAVILVLLLVAGIVAIVKCRRNAHQT